MYNRILVPLIKVYAEQIAEIMDDNQTLDLLEDNLVGETQYAR